MKIIDRLVLSNVEPNTEAIWLKPDNGKIRIQVFNNGKWNDVVPEELAQCVTAEELAAILLGYQKAESGKGLSTNDFTDTYKGIVNSVGEVIPTQATSSNQLADKEFVNSSIASSTATFQGTVNDVASLPTQNVDNNDYAFVISTDSDGNTLYSKYKYNGTSWVFEYALNNSSFTAVQWAAIQSGITAELVSKLSALYDKAALDTLLAGKVGSTSVRTIATLTQAEYDALSTKDANTEYNIIESV